MTCDKCEHKKVCVFYTGYAKLFNETRLTMLESPHHRDMLSKRLKVLLASNCDHYKKCDE